MAQIRIDYTIEFGKSLRVGYRVQNSGNPFTYVTPYPTYADSPYFINGLPLQQYEVELTPVCPNCSGAQLGSPTIYPALNV